jgi:hypothetical protein
MIKDKDLFALKGQTATQFALYVLVASPSWLSTNTLYLYLLNEMRYVFDEPRGESKYIIKGKRSLTYVY